MRLYRRTTARKRDHVRYRQSRLGRFESLESRQLLNAAPVAADDEYSVLQDTVLSVDHSVLYPSPESFPGLETLQSIDIGYTARLIAYSQSFNLLFVHDSTEGIHVIDTKTGTEIDFQESHQYFGDFDLTDDGRYLYASDFGEKGYIHRFDAVSREWSVKQVPINAYRVEAVDDQRFLLLDDPASSDLSLFDFGTSSSPMTELHRVRVGNRQDIEYDAAAKLAFVTTTANAQGTTVYALEDDTLVRRGLIPFSGPSAVFSTHGPYFYTGGFQFTVSGTPLLVRQLSEIIDAAAGGLAFGAGNYYSSETGLAVGQLPFRATVYGASENGESIWTYDSAGERLHHYKIPYYPLYGVLANDTDADQDPLTAAIVDGPQNGDLNLNSNGSFDYTPNPGFAGTDSFGYQVIDGLGNQSNISTVTITVRPNNTAPDAIEDNFRVEYETPLSVTRPPLKPFAFREIRKLPSQDTDYVVAQVEFAQHSGLLFLREGSSAIHIIDSISGSEIDRHLATEAFADFDLTPDGRYLYVSDFGGESAGASVRPSWVHRYDISARQWEVKQAPMIAHGLEAVDKDRFLLLESDQTAELTLNHFGATADAPIAELSRVSYSLEQGNIEFDHRTGLVFHGSANSSSKKVSVIEVEGDTLKPQYQTQSFTQTSGTALTLSPDGKYLFYAGLSLSPADARQVLRVFPGSVTASTAGLVFGGFTILAAETGEAVGSMVHPGFRHFASDDGLYFIAHDTTVNQNFFFYQVRPLGWGVLENDTDAERDPLSASLVSNPSHGVLVLNADGTFEYTPNDGYYGDDSFTYLASDGLEDSNVGTVNLTVASLPPTATDDSYTVAEDGTLEVAAAKGLLVNDSDPEAQPLTAVVVEGPRNGTLTLNEVGSLRYVPRADFFGTDSFTYQASDGVSKSAIATVNLTVTGTPDAPVGIPDSYTVAEDGKLPGAPGVLANDVDADGDKLTAAVFTRPTHGVLHFPEDGRFTYVPNTDFTGTDQFTYSVSDGISQSAPVTVTITVTPVNDAPIAKDDSYATNEDSPLTVAAQAGVVKNDFDIDGDKLFAKITTLPAHGTIDFAADGSFVYTPRADFNGADSFRYRVSDGVASSEATATIVVMPLGDPPRAVPDSYSVPEDTTLTVTPANGVLKNDTDPDLNILTAKLVTGPAHGELTLNNDGDFVYRPDANFFGTDSFTYSAYDGLLSPEPAKVTITIAPVNDAPVAADDAYRFGGQLTVPAAKGLLQNDRDVDSVQLTASVVDGPQHGKLALHADGSFTYVPGPSFLVADSFTYRTSDELTQSNVANVVIEAQLSIITENVTLTSRDDGPVEGFFDVILRVPPGESLSAAGYEVILGAPAGSGIEFLTAELAPGSPLFAGQAPVATVVGDRLLVTDLAQNGSVTVQDGARLFRVHFQATPSAIGSIPLSFDPSFTSLSDASGRPLPLENMRAGVITVFDGIAPKVTELSISGAGWTDSFRDHLAELDLGAGGFAIPHGTSQSPILPWTNLDRISVRFSEDVQVDETDLRLAGINRESYSFAGMNYDEATFTATWILSAPLAADTLTVTLDGGGEDAVRDRAGNILDGDPSPDAAGDFQAGFSALPGDVDRSGFTNVLDTVKTRNLQFARAGDSRYTIFHDVDGSGSVSVFDTIQVRSNQFMGLPGADEAIDPAPPVVRLRTENVTVAAPAGEAVEVVFDVFVEAIAGADLSVAGYDAALRMAPDSGFTFVSASAPSAAHPSVFSSRPTEFALQDLFGVTDIVATAALPLADNEGLFSVRILISPDTLGTFAVTFDTEFTHLVDAGGNALPIEFLPGAITVVPGLPAVTDLTASAVAANAVQLAWTDSFDGESGFKIERLEGNDFVEIAVVGANVTQFEDTQLQSSRDFVYRVRAFSTDGNGNASSPTTITTPQLTAISGTPGDDSFHIVRSGDLLQVYQNAAPMGRPTYSSALADMTGVLTIDAGDGNDELTVASGEQAELGLDRLIFSAGAGDNSLILASGAAEIESTATGGTLDTTVEEEAHLITPRLSQNGLTLADNSRVSLLPNGATSVITSLAIGGDATLDINNNALVLDYTGDSPVEWAREKILAGRTRPNLGDGVWTGNGITSSAAAAANVIESESRAVGYAENALLPFGPYTNYLGVPVDDTSVLITFTRTGDANLDGRVNDEDVTILNATYAPSTPNPHWAQADFDYNGLIDDDDVTVMGVFYDPEAGGFDQAIGSVAVPQQKAGDDALLDLLAKVVAGDHSRQSRESAARDWFGADAAFESLEDWRPIARRKVVL